MLNILNLSATALLMAMTDHRGQPVHGFGQSQSEPLVSNRDRPLRGLTRVNRDTRDMLFSRFDPAAADAIRAERAARKVANYLKRNPTT